MSLGPQLSDCRTLHVSRMSMPGAPQTLSRDWLWNHACTLVGQYIFVSGGYDRFGNARSRLFALDINRWVWREDFLWSYDVSEHVMLLVDDGLVVLGGQSGRHVTASAIYRFDLATEQLERRRNTAVDLVPRFKCAGEYVESLGVIVLFGGAVNGLVTNKVVAYDVSANVWTEIRPKGQPPHPRYGHSSCLHGKGDIFFYGGSGGDRFTQFPGITHLRASKRSYTWCETAWSPSPNARTRSTIQCTGSRIFILGGYRGSNPDNYFFVYDLNKNVGAQLAGKREDTRRERPAADLGIVELDGHIDKRTLHTAVATHNRVIVMGGIHHNGSDVLLLTASGHPVHP